MILFREITEIKQSGKVKKQFPSRAMPAAMRCPIKAADPLSGEGNTLALCRDAACRHLAVPGRRPGPREASRPGGET